MEVSTYFLGALIVRCKIGFLSSIAATTATNGSNFGNECKEDWHVSEEEVSFSITLMENMIPHEQKRKCLNGK